MSTTERTVWEGTCDLPLGKTILLEASAGTGKTYQIAGLVVRLVAEYRVPIDRILVITFTKAATAELKHRVRQRLAKARDVMGETAAPENDDILKALWSEPTLRDERRALLEAALSGFDQAPISTIHGFCQRMLDQLAFESGQEPGLTLVQNVKPVIDELVTDAMAHVYAQATAAELGFLEKANWTKARLSDIADTMTKAVAPAVQPSVSLSDENAGVMALKSARKWPLVVAEFMRWWKSEAKEIAIAAIQAEVAKNTRKKRIKGLGKRTNTALQKLDDWRLGQPKKGITVKTLTLETLHKEWDRDSSSSPEDFEGRAVYEWGTKLAALSKEELHSTHAEFCSWWDSDSGRLAVAALLEEASPPPSRIKGVGKPTLTALQSLSEWCEGDTLRPPTRTTLTLK
ncbi:MAG: UvrD-helicase domain-containing protein, partial [Myxococcota bacterium]|nr:UvrD-helicase domain-containing protein [Myxococcota bacterium]